MTTRTVDFGVNHPIGDTGVWHGSPRCGSVSRMPG
jgi:hypothetical protein